MARLAAPGPVPGPLQLACGFRTFPRFIPARRSRNQPPERARALAPPGAAWGGRPRRPALRRADLRRQRHHSQPLCWPHVDCRSYARSHHLASSRVLAPPQPARIPSLPNLGASSAPWRKRLCVMCCAVLRLGQSTCRALPEASQHFCRGIALPFCSATLQLSPPLPPPTRTLGVV